MVMLAGILTSSVEIQLLCAGPALSKQEATSLYLNLLLEMQWGACHFCQQTGSYVHSTSKAYLEWMLNTGAK